MRFAHTNIISKDWQRLANFYIQVFGCEIIPPERNQSGEWLSRGTGVKNAHLRGAHLRLPGYGDAGPTLEIYQYHEVLDSPKPFSNREGFGHIAFEVDDVEEIAKKIVEHGGSRYGEIIRREIEGLGIITFTYIRDPDGNIIELQNWSSP